MTPKEAAIAWFRRMGYTDAQVDTAMKPYSDDMTGYPRLEEGRDYTRPEFNLLHFYDQCVYRMAGRIVRSVKTTEAIETKPEIGRPATKITKLSPSAFMREVAVNTEVDKPKELSHSSLYTAARNLGMGITIQQRGDKYVVTRHN